MSIMTSTLSVQRSPEGVPYTVPNRTTHTSPDFYVSFNNVDRGIYGCETTAVVVGRQMDRFYVLCGNHEKALAGKSFEDALSYLHAHAEQLNKYSDPLPPPASTIEAILSSPRRAAR